MDVPKTPTEFRFHLSDNNVFVDCPLDWDTKNHIIMVCVHCGLSANGDEKEHTWQVSKTHRHLKMYCVENTTLRNRVEQKDVNLSTFFRCPKCLKAIRDLRCFKRHFNTCVILNGPKTPPGLGDNPQPININICLSTGAVSPKGRKAINDILHVPNTYEVFYNVDAHIPFTVHPDSHPKSDRFVCPILNGGSCITSKHETGHSYAGISKLMRHISERHGIDTNNKHGVFCPSCSNSCLRKKYRTHVCSQLSSPPPISELPTTPGQQREREPFDSTSQSVLTPGLLSSTLLEGTGDSSRLSNPITPGCLFQKGRTAHPFYAGPQNFATPIPPPTPQTSTAELGKTDAAVREIMNDDSTLEQQPANPLNNTVTSPKIIPQLMDISDTDPDIQNLCLSLISISLRDPPPQGEQNTVGELCSATQNPEDQSLYFLEPFDSWEEGKKDTYDKYATDVLDTESKLSSCQRCFVSLGRKIEKHELEHYRDCNSPMNCDYCTDIFLGTGNEQVRHANWCFQPKKVETTLLPQTYPEERPPLACPTCGYDISGDSPVRRAHIEQCQTQTAPPRSSAFTQTEEPPTSELRHGVTDTVIPRIPNSARLNEVITDNGIVSSPIGAKNNSPSPVEIRLNTDDPSSPQYTCPTCNNPILGTRNVIQHIRECCFAKWSPKTPARDWLDKILNQRRGNSASDSPPNVRNHRVHNSGSDNSHNSGTDIEDLRCPNSDPDPLLHPLHTPDATTCVPGRTGLLTPMVSTFLPDPSKPQAKRNINFCEPCQVNCITKQGYHKHLVESITSNSAHTDLKLIKFPDTSDPRQTWTCTECVPSKRRRRARGKGVFATFEAVRKHYANKHGKLVPTCNFICHKCEFTCDVFNPPLLQSHLATHEDTFESLPHEQTGIQTPEQLINLDAQTSVPDPGQTDVECTDETELPCAPTPLPPEQVPNELSTHDPNGTNVDAAQSSAEVDHASDAQQWADKIANCSTFDEVSAAADDWIAMISPKKTETAGNGPNTKKSPVEGLPFRKARKGKRPGTDYSQDAQKLQKLYKTSRKKAMRMIIKDQDINYSGGVKRANKFFKEVHSAQKNDLSKMRNIIFETLQPVSKHSALDLDTSPDAVLARYTKVSNTAAGNDCTDYNTLKKHDPKGKVLSAIYSQCYRHGKVPASWKIGSTILIHKKDDPKDPGNFRPIALLKCIYKIYTGLLADAFQKWTKDNNIISPEQKGFVPGMEGCFEHSFQTNLIIQEARRLKGDVSIAWLDLANAFGSVPHDAINLVLERLNAPAKIRTIISDLLKNCFSKFQTPDGETDSIPIEAGVRQGDPISSILFNLVLEVLLRNVKRLAKEKNCGFRCGEHSIDSQAYADDLQLSALKPHQLQSLLTEIGRVATIIGLKFKPSKCATFTLIKGQPKVFPDNQRLLIQGKPMASLDNGQPYKYLGSASGINVKNLLIEELIETCCTMVSKVETSLLAPWQKLDAIRTFILTKISFSQRASFVNKGPFEKFLKCLNKALKNICYLPKRACNAYFYSDRKCGGLGLLNPKLDHDVQSITQALKMLTSPDTRLRSMANYQLSSTIEDCLGRPPTIEERLDFLSGSKEGDLSKYKIGTKFETIWTRCRHAANRLGVKFSSNSQSEVQLRIVNRFDHSKPIGRAKVVEHLRAVARSIKSKELLDLRDQGKFARSHVLDPNSKDNGSAWIFNGHGIRFCDWRFIHRARLNLLPLNGVTAKFTGRTTPATCRNCPDRETLPHVSQHCKKVMVSITERHNKAALRLYNAAQCKKSWNVKDKEVPTTNARPDLVFERVNDKGKREVTLVDVVCPFEGKAGALAEECDRKPLKYDSIAQSYRARGIDAEVHGFAIGALGTWLVSNDAVFSRIGIPNKARKALRQRMCTDVIAGSRDVYVEHVSGKRQWSKASKPSA